MFAPKYNTQYILPIIRNIKEYLKANEADAFTWVVSQLGTEPLKATVTWRLSRWYNTLFPVTSVFPLTTVPAEADDASRIEETHRITVETEIDGNNPDHLVEIVCARIAAYDALLRKISKHQLLNGLNLTTSGGEFMDIGEHNYRYFAQSPTLYKLTGSFDLTVHVIEGRSS